ncbi:general stress protein [Virgibacillus halophilus]|uniref:general stress protein n=1 Tax=Tigheibacillus halophilus TaxID=361280 RepID=UPI003627F87E
MKPTVKEFKDDVELKKEVKKLSEQGISKDKLYVMSHDDDRTDRVADSIAAGKLGEGFTTESGNVFTKKGDELRAQFKELGFTQDEANEFEKKLDHGTILLINTAS